MRNWPKQQFVEVSDGIVVAVNGSGESGVSNATFVLEHGRAMVIDTMTFPTMAEEMAQRIAQHGASVDLVLNTHHHIDHIGGNKRFAEAHIIAHPTTVEALAKMGKPTQLLNKLMPKFYGQFDDLELVTPLPDLEYLIPPRGGELYAFRAAHTASDVTVWFPESRTLIASDISFIGVTPLAVHGLLSGWIKAIDSLLALKPQVVVPGHGRIGSAEDLVTLQTYLRSVLAMGQHAVDEGISLREALANLDVGPVAEWLETERHAINLERAMQEARGEISRSNLSALPPGLQPRGV